jgi:GNAT superfamily N-acetyltransferase
LRAGRDRPRTCSPALDVGRFWYAIVVQPDLAISVRLATAADASQLAALVNRAYEVEAFFVEGDRTSAAEVAELAARGSFVVLEQGGGLAAAVYVEPTGYFGMLAVQPELQGHGLGRRLVRIAEAMCEAAGASTVSMRIINLREDLGRWYRAQGYVEVGTTPYEHRSVKQPCHFVEMRKDLRHAVARAA